MTLLTPEQLAEIERRHLNAPLRTNSFAHYHEAHSDRRSLLSHVSALTAEIAALRRDAERYRWLRTAGAWESEIGMDELSKDPAKFDAAIDSAMSSAGGCQMTELTEARVRGKQDESLSLLPLRVMAAHERGEIGKELATDILDSLKDAERLEYLQAELDKRPHDTVFSVYEYGTRIFELRGALDRSRHLHAPKVLPEREG